MSAAVDERLRVAGIDVGSSAVKVVILETDGEEDTRVLAGINERIRRRDPQEVVGLVIAQSLEQAGVRPDELAYIATTGEGEMVASRTGHFYGMTTHARGGLFLDPEARAIIDIGALHARAVLFDDRAKVLGYRMTSQCASGSGQFLENICRYLGITIDEIGPLSLEADAPEACSSICAVLAETDVINMVSRGISTSNIIKGIHQSMAGRYIRLISSVGSRGVVLVTGGLATDVGLVEALKEAAVAGKTPVEIRSHKESVLAGALGAALWGAFRTRKLARDGVSFTAPQSAHQHGGRDATDHTG
jgi:benzoyl-CoA reductase subunit D